MGKISLGTDIIYDDTSGATTSEIKYKSHVMPVYTAGATSLSLTIPSDTVEGDLLIVCMFARSLVTAPSGWTQAIKQSINTANTQWLLVFYKIASSIDVGATLTFNQATSGRMAISLIVAACPASGAAIDVAAGTFSATSATVPSATSSGLGRLCLLAHTAYFATVSAINEYYMHGNGWIIINNPYLIDSRIAISIIHMNSGPRPLTYLTKKSDLTDTAAVAVIFKPI